MLDFLGRCFDSDELDVNGQPILFLPRPKKPPIFVGGGSDAALARAVRAGDG
jgi:alkanesulfonate monooxygenase SsuD/methylene tetrahydromethanopterin reductase-like flavin-dependent oxidoreductase (luciferase family)